MKKIFTTILLAMIAVTTWAYDVEVDGIYYNLNTTDKTAAVTNETTSSPGSYSGSVTIPETLVSNGVTYSVTSIGDYAFWDCSGLTSVTIPNFVTSIGKYAFCNCSGLTSVTIPNSVTIIGGDAFSLTPWFDEYSKKEENIYENIVYINDVAYKATSTSITSCDLKNKTVSISGSAFSNCTGLTSVTIPNPVTSIGDWAFSNCTGLTSVAIPNSVTNIGWDAFSHTPWYDEYSKKEENIYGNIVYINDIAYKATSTSITSCDLKNKTVSISGSAFSNCTGLTSVTIPNSVTSIGENAFSGCCRLTSVTIPNSVRLIDSGAFYGCSGLTSVTIPNSVTSIGRSVFSRCTGLTSVTIPNSVTSIGDFAFMDCTGLTSVTIPNSVMRIGFWTFYGCSGLTSVYNYATTPQNLSSSYDFSNAANCTLYVPKGSMDTYKAADYWKEFKEILEIPYAKGDVNHDGYVNSTDINVVLTVMTGGASNPDADVNGDGYVNSTDINAILSVMTGGK